MVNEQMVNVLMVNDQMVNDKGNIQFQRVPNGFLTGS